MKYVIAIGDPFSGLSLYCKTNNKLFEYEEALAYAEYKFKDQNWWIVEVNS